MTDAMSTTILVVEDDAQLAGLVSETLEREGYQVLLAADGDAAFRLFLERGETIDVLLVDVMLPRINGLDLTILVQGQWPGTKIILCSGQLSSAELAQTGVAYLPKPYTGEDLLQTLDRLVPRPPSRKADLRQPKGVRGTVPSPPLTIPAGGDVAESFSTTRQPQSVSSTITKRSGEKRPSILIVDDEPEVARLLRDFLTRQGYALKFAATGGEALALIQKQAPDLLLMDLAMPGVNGVEMLRRLKRLHPAGLPFGVIILTGTAGEPLFEEARSLGVSDILLKPLDPALLDAAIKLQLNQKS
jgi:CheY-like chemotaxis protein